MAGKSAEKQVRVSGRKEKRNQAIVSKVKTSITRAEKLIASGQTDEAKKAVVTAVSALDKAAGKQIIHSGNADRRKSRLLKRLNSAAAKPAAKS